MVEQIAACLEEMERRDETAALVSEVENLKAQIEADGDTGPLEQALDDAEAEDAVNAVVEQAESGAIAAEDALDSVRSKVEQAEEIE